MAKKYKWNFCKTLCAISIFLSHYIFNAHTQQRDVRYAYDHCSSICMSLCKINVNLNKFVIFVDMIII